MSGKSDIKFRVAVFGSGADLWQAAAMMQKQLPASIEIALIEEAFEDSGATSIRLDDPSIIQLGVDIAALNQAPSSVYSLGTELKNWRSGDSSFFLAGSGSLPDIDGFPVHQIMRHAASIYANPDQLPYLYQPFQLPQRLAEARKMAWTSPDPLSPLSMLRPSVHIQRSELAGVFERQCKALKTYKAIPVNAKQSSNTNDILEVSLSDGSVIEADFFVDLSGQLEALVGSSLTTDWKSLCAKIPFDQWAHVRTDGIEQHTLLQSQAIAMDGALLIKVPLRQSCYQQLLFAEADSGNEKIQKLAGKAFKTCSIEFGYSSKPWTQNIVRVGRSSAQLGPFLSANQIAFTRAISNLLNHFPCGKDMELEARSYNRKFNSVIEQISDFVVMPFHLNGREDSFWRHMANSSLSEPARIRLDQFRSRGLLVEFEDEQFDMQNWIDLFMGFRIIPERTHPLLQGVDMDLMSKKLRNLAKAFDLAIASTSSHAEFDQTIFG